MTASTQAVIYCRISLDPTGQGLGVERQESACRQLAEARGWAVAEVIVDNSVSAYSGKVRPGFDRLVRLIETGQVRTVLAWAVDRLTRSIIDLERLIELAQRHGAIIVTASGDLDLSHDQGRMVARILASVARGEVERKAARQRAASQQAAHAGRRTVGRRPFGYDDDGVTIREAEAEAIRDGYRQLLGGVPLAAIARDWNARGFTTGQARRACRERCGTCSRCKRAGDPSPWRADSVRVVLTNPRNIALRQYRGEIVGPAVWPAVIDEPTYRAAAALLSNPSRATGGGSNARALLTGVALCGVCGATIHGGGGRGAGTLNYRCSGSLGHFSRRAEPVDEYVGQVVCARLSRPDARDLLHDQQRPDVEELRREAMELRARLDTLAAEFADGELTASQLRTATERIRSRLSTVESTMADAGRVDVLGPLVGADDVTAVWAGLSTARRRAVIGALITVRVQPPGRGVRTFDPTTIDVEWLVGR